MKDKFLHLIEKKIDNCDLDFDISNLVNYKVLLKTLTEAGLLEPKNAMIATSVLGNLYLKDE